MTLLAKPCRIFLGGPIKAGFSAAGFDPGLRAAIAGLLNGLRRAGIEVRNAHEHEQFQIIDQTEPVDVVRRDYRWLRQCDVYVPILPLRSDGQLYPSVGSGVEIGWATLLDVPVVALVELDRLTSYSPFLRGLSGVFRFRLQDLAAAGANPDGLGSVLREEAAAAPRGQSMVRSPEGPYG